jgi:hypothetical protein
MTVPLDPMAASGRAAKSRGALRYFFFVRHANDRSGRPFLVWRSAFKASSCGSGRSCIATGEFGVVVVGSRVDAGRLLIGRRLQPSLPQLRSTFVGHIILFIARMSFVLATSVFGFVFIARRPEFQIPTSRYVVLVIGLLALFCYAQELEHLGRALIGPGPSPWSH